MLYIDIIIAKPGASCPFLGKMEKTDFLGLKILIFLLKFSHKMSIYTPKKIFFQNFSLIRHQYSYLKSTSIKNYFHKMNMIVFFFALKKLCKKNWKIVKTEKKFFTTFFKNGINPPKNQYFLKISFLAVYLQPLLIPRIDKSRF